MSTIRSALADYLNEWPGMQAGTNPAIVFHDKLTDSVVAPCVVVVPAPSGAIDYLQAFSSGNADWGFELVVLAGRTNEAAAQEIIDQLASPTGDRSIAAAIRADDTLGGRVAYAVATSMGDYGSLTVGAVEYVSCRIEVEVNL